MRNVNVLNQNYKKIAEYSLDKMQDCMEDLTGNGYTAIDIKFDFDGDIVILAVPVL